MRMYFNIWRDKALKIDIKLLPSYLIFPNPDPPDDLAEVPITAAFFPAAITLEASAPLKGKPFFSALDPTLLLRNSLHKAFPFSPTPSIPLCLLDHSH